MVNGYNCQFYDINNLFIVSKVRSEHLSEEELKKNEERHKKMKEQLMKSKQTLNRIYNYRQFNL